MKQKKNELSQQVIMNLNQNLSQIEEYASISTGQESIANLNAGSVVIKSQDRRLVEEQIQGIESSFDRQTNKVDSSSHLQQLNSIGSTEHLQHRVYKNSPLMQQFQNPLQMSIEKKNKRNKQEYLRMMGQQTKNNSQLQPTKPMKHSGARLPQNS